MAAILLKTEHHWKAKRHWKTKQKATIGTYGLNNQFLVRYSSHSDTESHNYCTVGIWNPDMFKFHMAKTGLVSNDLDFEYHSKLD